MKRWIGLNYIVGIWLLVAPLIWSPAGVTTAWAVNEVAIGSLLIGFSWSILAAAEPPTGVLWSEISCGIWLIVAPFTLGYATANAATWNDVICGLIAVVIAAVVARATTRTTVV